MTEHLKPCRKCGSEHITHWSDTNEIECHDCDHLEQREDWQAPNAREKALEDEVERLRDTLAEYMGKLSGMEKAYSAVAGKEK